MELMSGASEHADPPPNALRLEVITIEIVGEFLGLDEDTQLFAYFRRHYPTASRTSCGCIAQPSAGRRPTSGRSKSTSGKRFRRPPHDPAFAICDSMPLRACLFARAYRCRRFRGEAAFGKDTLLRQTFYGFWVHVRICWPGAYHPLLGGPGQRP